jgi:hypothetical protein
MSRRDRERGTVAIGSSLKQITCVSHSLALAGEGTLPSL